MLFELGISFGSRYGYWRSGGSVRFRSTTAV